MSWLWSGLYWVWSADPLLVSLIVLAWFLGSIAVLFVDPQWLGYVRRVQGVHRSRRWSRPPVEPELVVEEPVAEVVPIVEYRRAS